MSLTSNRKMYRHTQTLFPSTDEDAAVTSNTLGARGQDVWPSLLQYSVIGVLTLVALILNVLVIVAYYGKWRKSTNLFIIVLASVDIFSSLVFLLDSVLRKHFIDDSAISFYTSSRQSLIYFGNVTSALLVVCITVYRFIKIPSLPGVERLGIKGRVFMTLGSVLVSMIASVPFVIIHISCRNSSNLSNVTIKKEDVTRNMTNGDQGVLGAIRQRAGLQITPISTSVENLSFLIFHVVVALLILLAFLCVIVMNSKLAFTLMQNGLRMSKHSKQNRRGANRLLGEQNSNLPSGTDVSQSSRSSDPLDRVELRKKLSSIIAKQVTDIKNQKRQSTMSFQSTAKLRTPLKTIPILLLAGFLFLFNFPALCLNIIRYIQPSINFDLQTKSDILCTMLQYSYVVCFLGNPLVYGIFNQEFSKTLKQICCVKEPRSLPRHRKQVLVVKRTPTITYYNPEVWYPNLCELEARTKSGLTGI